jgi:hypothetical protein
LQCSATAPPQRASALAINDLVSPTVEDQPKWIIGDKAGAATVTDASGNALTDFPITGLEQHVAATAITSLSTTIKVWGTY